MRRYIKEGDGWGDIPPRENIRFIIAGNYYYKEAPTGECGIVSQSASDRLPLRQGPCIMTE
jgi:hypothetical protein